MTICMRLRSPHLANSAPCRLVRVAVRDKYRGPQWLCVACTTPYASSAALLSALIAAGGGGGDAPGCAPGGCGGGEPLK